MPWSPAQHRLFEAAAHNPAIAKSRGIPQEKASQMASEGMARPNTVSNGGINTSQRKAVSDVPAGLKRQTKPQRLAMALSSYKGKPNLPGV